MDNDIIDAFGEVKLRDNVSVRARGWVVHSHVNYIPHFMSLLAIKA